MCIINMYKYVYVHIYLYIYIEREGVAGCQTTASFQNSPIPAATKLPVHTSTTCLTGAP